MMDVNWIAILISAVVFNAIGFAWYSDSVFGKAWRRESGITKEQISEGSKNMGRMFFFMAVGSIVMAYVMSVVFSAFQTATVSDALAAAFWLWVGFVATVLLNGVVCEFKSWKYYSITAGYQLVGMLAMGAVLVLLG